MFYLEEPTIEENGIMAKGSKPPTILFKFRGVNGAKEFTIVHIVLSSIGVVWDCEVSSHAIDSGPRLKSLGHCDSYQAQQSYYEFSVKR